MTERDQDGDAAEASALRGDFAAYLGSSALWLAGMQLQQFLVTWMLVGILAESGTRLGLAQLMIALPGLVLMLFGGSLGDRSEPRRVLLRVQAAAAAMPLLLIAFLGRAELGYAAVILFGLSLTTCNAYTEPTRAAFLNRVAGAGLQRGVTLTTGVSALFGLFGTWLGGRIDSLGLDSILIGQSLMFAAAALAIAGIRRPPTVSAPRTGSAFAEVAEGLLALSRTPLVRAIISLNFVSSLFNAGAWFVVYPLLVTRLYGGDAALLALLVVVFFAGSILANFGLLAVMPLVRPGRLFLLMQLTRVVLFALLWSQPPMWLLLLVTVGWGLNMGITTTTSRVLVQTLAPEARRARMLSVFIMTTMAAAPLGAMILGPLVEFTSVRTGFLPGVLASLTILAVGLGYTGLWTYRDDGAR